MIVRRIETFQPSPGQRVIVTGPDPHPIVVGVGPRDQPVDHEEADVLIAYHMLQEAKIGQTTIKVVSDDTDVLNYRSTTTPDAEIRQFLYGVNFFWNGGQCERRS